MPIFARYKRYKFNNEEKKIRDNLVRKKKRGLLREKRLAGKQCLLCTIRMDKHSSHSRIYCDDCLTRFPDEARRHRWQRYYYRTLKPRRERKVN